MLIENIQSLFMGLGGGLLPYIYKIYIDNKTINIK